MALTIHKPGTHFPGRGFSDTPRSLHLVYTHPPLEPAGVGGPGLSEALPRQDATHKSPKPSPRGTPAAAIHSRWSTEHTGGPQQSTGGTQRRPCANSQEAKAWARSLSAEGPEAIRATLLRALGTPPAWGFASTEAVLGSVRAAESAGPRSPTGATGPSYRQLLRASRRHPPPHPRPLPPPVTKASAQAHQETQPHLSANTSHATDT